MEENEDEDEEVEAEVVDDVIIPKENGFVILAWMFSEGNEYSESSLPDEQDSEQTSRSDEEQLEQQEKDRN